MHSGAISFLLALGCCGSGAGFKLAGAEARATPAGNSSAALVAAPADSNARFNVRAYRSAGDPVLVKEGLPAALTNYTGAGVGIQEIVKAAWEVQREYRKLGHLTVNIAVAPERMTNGILTLNVFRGRVPQVLISGKRRPELEAETAVVSQPPPAAKTNAGPRLNVRAYEIHGDTLLSDATLTGILAKYTGTNIGLAEIKQAGTELQAEYRARGYPTVSVIIPAQNIATNNGRLRVSVFEGRLAGVVVQNNRYFSSNNILRAFPSLHTNQILSEPVLTAELDRANANQDRQIYPQLEPGPETDTTLLRLKVKDRLPLHAKLEFNNQSSPGTPEMRVNASAAYQNLWQLDHSVGVQYSFSPEEYKLGNQWSLYDQPLVANYGAFYRMPLGNPESVTEAIAGSAGNFGYDEATRQFHLPPASGRAELNVYASRSTIDTGLISLSRKTIQNIPGVLSIGENDVQEELTVNEALGSRLSLPLPSRGNFQSSLTGGLDAKHYHLLSMKTNNFYFSIITRNELGVPNPPVYSTVASPVPATDRPLEYLPLLLRYDATLRDPRGMTTFGFGLSVNAWYSGSLSNLHNVTGSTESSGHWVTLSPSLGRDLAIPPFTNWVLSLRANGQWTSEPLLSTEQFGLGGVASIRGYREGEVFGDNGWWVSAEEKTPTHLIGWASSKQALTVRGSLFMDYGQSYLIDPQGRQGCIDLWGTGAGLVTAFGPHWEGRFLFSWPLISAGTSSAGYPRFNFSLTGQF
ncbi:MAG: ShlB/FhaC/HecB family hemolysin secretion/activation protein [Limisphaerales bacterium]